MPGSSRENEKNMQQTDGSRARPPSPDQEERGVDSEDRAAADQAHRARRTGEGGENGKYERGDEAV